MQGHEYPRIGPNLGPPARGVVRSNPTFLLASGAQRDLLDQFQRRCLHFSEAHRRRGPRPLCFSSTAYQKMHPSKEKYGCCDADATLASPMILGVCDGVSQVHQMGLDPSSLPRELLDSCEDIVTKQLLADIDHRSLQGQTEAYSGPIELLQEAYSGTESLGSTSVLLAVMDNSTLIHGKLHPMIGVVTLGDCELVLLRRTGRGRRGPLQVVLRTEMQRIGGHSQTPLQLLRMDEELDPSFTEADALDAIERGSGLHCLSAYEGDVLILGSDGIFDNLFLSEVVSICNEQLPPRGERCPFEPAHPSRLAEIAHALVERAHAKSGAVQGAPPQSTPVGVGGKADDTSVVVAEVVEWSSGRREAWARTHRRPSPLLQPFLNMFACDPVCAARVTGEEVGSEDEGDGEGGGGQQEDDVTEVCCVL